MSDQPEILTQEQLDRLAVMLRAVSTGGYGDETEVVLTRRAALALYNSLVTARATQARVKMALERRAADEVGAEWVLAIAADLEG